MFVPKQPLLKLSGLKSIELQISFNLPKEAFVFGSSAFWRLIPFPKFYKLCKLEDIVTRNDAIMMSLPKTMENADVQETSQIIYHSKGLDESYQNVSFIKFE